LGLQGAEGDHPHGLSAARRIASVFQLAQSQACWDQKEIGHQDFVGAVAGAIAGFWTTGPAAVPEAALPGGGSMSAAEVAWQIAKTFYCNVKTGGWKPPRPQPT
jgi:hypothetical protein